MNNFDDEEVVLSPDDVTNTTDTDSISLPLPANDVRDSIGFRRWWALSGLASLDPTKARAGENTFVNFPKVPERSHYNLVEVPEHKCHRSCLTPSEDKTYVKYWKAPAQRNYPNFSPSKRCWGQLLSSRATINLEDKSVVMKRNFLVRHNLLPSGKLVGKISRNHFALKVQHTVNGLNTVRITDLSSRGTYLNDNLIGKNQTMTLFDGDIISIVDPRYQLYEFKDFSNRRWP